MRTMRSGIDLPSILPLPSKSKKERSMKQQDGERVKFLTELYSILNDDTNQFAQFVFWNEEGNLLIIHDEKLFFQNVITIRFPKQTKIDSFNRQMRDWGFKKLTVNEKRVLNYSEELKVFKHATLNAHSTSSEIKLVPYKEESKKKSSETQKSKSTKAAIGISKSQPIPLKISTPQHTPLLSPRPQIATNSTHSSLFQLLNIVENEVESTNQDFFSQTTISPAALHQVPLTSNQQHRQQINFDFGSMNSDPWMIIDSSDESMNTESTQLVKQILEGNQPHDSYTTPPPFTTSNSSILTNSMSPRASPNPFVRLSPYGLELPLRVSNERSTSSKSDNREEGGGIERFSGQSRDYNGKWMGLKKRPSELFLMSNETW